ncbi:MAG TPA: ABC transporter substrate-binding protein, partial [Methylomirabilota bacterium]|nr:ABC transporter substrate-binding protein [Methylomirabilota bacterium]
MAGASPAGAQEVPRQGGELVFVVPAEPPSYDAHREETFAIVHPAAPHYSTLLRVDPFDRGGTRIVGDLAESWSASRDGRTYTFTLRRGVRFHDGGELTARDVKASYDKIIFPPPGIASNRKGEYIVVEAVEAPDPLTVVFRLKWASPSFLPSLASPFNWIYKAEILARDMRWYERNIMGTGPFTFVEYVKGSHWIGKKNASYWDKGKPYLDGYRALFVPDAAMQVGAIRGQRAMIQFRGFSPPERDTLMAALGSKITVQESPWECVNPLALKPRAQALRRQAGPPGPDPGPGSLAGRPGALEDHDPEGSSRRAGARNAVRRHSGRAGAARRLWTRHRQGARGSPAIASRGRCAGRLHLHVQESRDPQSLHGARGLARRPV